MPNYFAHLTFGAKVLDALPGPAGQALEGQRSAFDLGCLGPDILFFYHPATRNPVRLEGLEMHKHSALPAFERLRAGLEAGVPMAGGYAAGFLCHLALDSACHPYVNAQAARGEITHLAMEAEFDRALLLRAGLPARGRTYMPAPADFLTYRAASLAYVHASPEQVERGFLSMRWETRLLARFYGSRTGRLATRASRHLGKLKSTVGVVLAMDPDPASFETSAALSRLLDQAVPTAAGQVARFLEGAKTGAPLDPWLDRDFAGQLLPAPCQCASADGPV